MFKQLREIFNEILSATPKKERASMLTELAGTYGNLFLSLTTSQQQQMNQLLSVNCVFVAALHRIQGIHFFAPVLKALIAAFKTALAELEDEEGGKSRIKNILNVFLHLFLF